MKFVFNNTSPSSKQIDLLICLPHYMVYREFIYTYYIQKLHENNSLNILVIFLPTPQKKTLLKKECLTHFAELHAACLKNNIPNVFIADASYWKHNLNTSYQMGFGVPVTKDSVNYFPLEKFTNAKYSNKVTENIEICLTNYLNTLNNGKFLGLPVTRADIVKNENPFIFEAFKEWVGEEINTEDAIISMDIEALSLNHWEASVATVAFAVSESKAWVSPVDYFLERGTTDGLKALVDLRKILEWWKGKIIFHGSAYDVKVLIYTLYMKDLTDFKGLLRGFKSFRGRIHDTILMVYLQKNSCNKEPYNLKAQALEFAGDYGIDSEELTDILSIPKEELLQYNAIDALATYYLFNKYYSKDAYWYSLYSDLFLPFEEVLIYTGLCGMPLSMERVLEVEHLLHTKTSEARKVIMDSPLVELVQDIRINQFMETYNSTHKKQLDFKEAKTRVSPFNFGSGQQLAILIYQVIGLPVQKTTKTGAPSTESDVLKELSQFAIVQHNPDIKLLFDKLLEFFLYDKVLNTFIPAFKKAPKTKEGHHLLFGSLKSYGTISGRLSSSSPNLQNLPSKGELGKLVKSCFISPAGRIYGGADFNSLEDYISALQTKDPNKLAIYLYGFDSHCFRALSYFPEQMPDIEKAPENSICYKAKVGDTDIYFHSDEEIEYLGQVMKGKQLYDLLTNPRV